MRAGKITIAVIAVAAVATFFYGRDKLHFLSALLNEQADVAVAAKAAPHAMPVPVTPVVKKTLPIYLDYAARTESIRGIALQAKVSGFILEQAAADGVDVKQGDLLYRIDPRDYQAALEQVKAQAQRDQVLLDYAKTNLARGHELMKSGTLAKDLFDQRTSAVQQGEATLAADKAAIQTAQNNLGYTEIRAPFDGRLGRNQAPVGTLVNLGGTALNTLVQISPIYVTFAPSEIDLAAIETARRAGAVVAEVTVPGDSSPARQGELTFIDNAIDRATGTIVARATIANEDHRLRPGQYVNIRLLIGEQRDTLLVPQVALGSGLLGKYVYVVDEGGKVAMRLVELGPTDGDLVSVSKGITESDKIISGNLQKIAPGMPVSAVPAL